MYLYLWADEGKAVLHLLELLDGAPSIATLIANATLEIILILVLESHAGLTCDLSFEFCVEVGLTVDDYWHADLPLHTTVERNEVVELEVHGHLQVEIERVAAFLAAGKLFVDLDFLIEREDALVGRCTGTSLFWSDVVIAAVVGCTAGSSSAHGWLPATSAAEASTWATTSGAPATGTGTARTTRATRASTTEDTLGTAEEVQTIDDVEHGVARDGVVLGISTTHGRDNAGER